MQRLRKTVGDPKQLIPLAGQLMTPVAAAGYLLAAWRLGADMNWLGDFFISKGLLSRWQVWLALGAVTQVAANQIKRSAAPRTVSSPGA
jgi:hypothetical protein